MPIKANSRVDSASNARQVERGSDVAVKAVEKTESPGKNDPRGDELDLSAVARARAAEPRESEIENSADAAELAAQTRDRIREDAELAIKAQANIDPTAAVSYFAE